MPCPRKTGISLAGVMVSIKDHEIVSCFKNDVLFALISWMVDDSQERISSQACPLGRSGPPFKHKHRKTHHPNLYTLPPRKVLLNNILEVPPLVL